MKNSNQEIKEFRREIIHRLKRDGGKFNFSTVVEEAGIDSQQAREVAETVFARFFACVVDDGEFTNRERRRVQSLAERLKIGDDRRGEIEKKVGDRAYRDQLRDAHADDIVTDEERDELRDLQAVLGLSRDEIGSATSQENEVVPTETSLLQSLLQSLTQLFFGEDDDVPPLKVEELVALDGLPFLGRLPRDQKTLFFDLCGIFLKEVSIEGMQGLVPTLEDRVKVAASCSLLYVGRPEWPFPPVRSVFVSPHNFAEKTYEPVRDGKWAGFYRHCSDAVYMTSSGLAYSFTNDRDGYHLGLHEFAHALDGEDGNHPDGHPAQMFDDMKTLWGSILERERKKAGSANAALDAYSSKNLEEAFATSVVCFFEQPLRLKQKAADLYVLLAIYLNQDPAGHDERIMTELCDTVKPFIKSRKTQLVDGADIREGKIFTHALEHRQSHSLCACYRTKRGRWSVPRLVKQHLMAESLPRKPRTEVPVSVEIRGSQPHRISQPGHFPPLLRSDVDHIIEILKIEAPDAEDEMLRAVIIQAWNRMPAVQNGQVVDVP